MKNSFTIGKQQILLDTETSKEQMFWRLLAKQAWEPGTFKTFDRFISEESVCFDLGSWIGITTIYMAKLAKKVYGVEANPLTFEMLKKNLLLNSEVKNCVLLNNAVYDRNESMTFCDAMIFAPNDGSLKAR